MGLLDDLEQEAQRRKATLDEAGRLRQDRESVYKTQLEPGLQKLYEYLTKLTSNLGFLKPKTRLQHQLPGYGDVISYYEHDYELRIASQPQSKEITLTFSASVATDECPLVEVQGAPKVKSLSGTLQKHRLAGLLESRKDENGEIQQATFRARGKIPLNVTIAGDAESGQIRLSFTNFDNFIVLTKSIAPAQFNEELFDEIGRFLAREESNLFKEALPDDYRKQLQQKIQQENLKRKWESKIAQQQKDELERMRREQSFKGKIERTVQGVKDKTPSLLDRMKGIFKKS